MCCLFPALQHNLKSILFEAPRPQGGGFRYARSFKPPTRAEPSVTSQAQLAPIGTNVIALPRALSTATYG
jgi:hypothetical protein